MMICCEKENVLTPSLDLCLPPSMPPAPAQALQGFSLSPYVREGLCCFAAARNSPAQLPHCQSSLQQDCNGHALAEMATSYVGMNPVMFWPILDSGLQPAWFRQKNSSEWRKKKTSEATLVYSKHSQMSVCLDNS